MKKIVGFFWCMFLCSFCASNLYGWGATIRLTWNSGNSLYPDMAVDSSDVIHIVWADYTPGNYEIYYKKSTDHGTSWSAPQRLTWNSGLSDTPKIVIDWLGSLHVVWSDCSFSSYELLYKNSTDSGNTWGAVKRLTYTSVNSRNPDIERDLNNIYIVWDEPKSGYNQILFKKSTDYGVTWLAPQNLTFTNRNSYVPVMVRDANSNIHVVWHEDMSGNIEIIHKKSTDSGNTWSAPKRLTYLSGDSIYPALAADAYGAIYVVWEDRTHGDGEIYFKCSFTGGATWGAPKRLTWGSGFAYQPKIEIVNTGFFSTAEMHIVYMDGTPSNYDVFYHKSTDNGTNWLPRVRITWSLDETSHPTICKDFLTETINVAWADRLNGVGYNHEIYFKRD